MFVDEKKLQIKAGKGGDGVALFRHEIYVPRGGPDGGDGGRGGDVTIEGQSNLHTLSHLAHAEKVAAENGLKGGHKTSTGKSGKHEVIVVPLGTTILEKIGEDEWNQIAEITEEGQTFLLAKGGNGGWGNWHFRSSIQQAPDRFNPGLPGEEKIIKLVLKLIADVGLVGLPNAGKSTFLSSVSAARPKIANYPFTTLAPQLGVAQVGRGEGTKHIVIADLPGLIEGASSGKGLGVTFLKHIERTKSILHCIDCSVDQAEIKESYDTIRAELVNWNKEVSSKPEVIVLTKIDLISAEDLQEKLAFVKTFSKKPVFAISASTHKGVTDLLTNLDV